VLKAEENQHSPTHLTSTNAHDRLPESRIHSVWSGEVCILCFSWSTL